MNFQVRSDTTGIQHFDTFDDAYKTWKSDKTIWKISCDGKDGKSHRFVPKLKKDKWSELNEIFMSISEEYRKASDDTLFWIDQPLEPNNLLSRVVDAEDKFFPIVGIYSDNKFKKMFSIKK